MSSELLSELLRDAPVPDSSAARERVVAVARSEAETEAVGRAPTRRGVRPRRPLAVLLAVALVGLGLLTPPGRAAIEKAADLVGIGDVGGPPTGKRHPGIAPSIKPVVVDNGTAPDESRYEWVAYRGGFSYRVEGRKVRFSGFCVGLEWPGNPKRGGHGSGCVGSGKPPTGVWDSFGIFAMETGDVMISAGTRPQVRAVRIVYTDLRGARHDVPVDFTRIDGNLLRRAGGRYPFGTLVAFLPARQAKRDRLTRRFRLGSIVPPAPPVPKRFRNNPLRRCSERYGTPPTPSPFVVTVYGSGGRVIERKRWVQGHLAPPRCQRLMRRLSREAEQRD